jgi:alpha-1,3/alpha-1,6-mannosyltransferase
MIEKYGDNFVLSLNRYERKKRVDLAIQAYALLREKVPDTQTKLIVAGGYDIKCITIKLYLC